MQVFTTRVKTNLDGTLQMTQMIDGIMMTGDNAANEILVELYRGINRVTIPQDTKIVGYFIRSDGYTLEEDGVVTENNEAKVVIPEAAYQVSGNLSIAIRMFDGAYTATYRGYYDENNIFIQVTDENQIEGPNGEPIVTKEFQAWETKIVIATFNCFVQITETDSIIDVYHHIPDVQELLAYIETLDNRREEIEQEETARAIAEGTRQANETQRQTDFTTAMSGWNSTFSGMADQFNQNETKRQGTFETNEAQRQAQETARVQAESTRQSNETTRQSNESTRQTQETAREQAQAVRNALIDGMTVEANELAPYSTPTVTITEVAGHKHIIFGLRPGDPFVIQKVFTSVAEMNAYTGTDIRPGQFVVIAVGGEHPEEDPDNAKMYVKTPSGYSFIMDLSGAQGIQGPIGLTGNGIASCVLNQDYTLTVNYTDGTSYTTTNSIRGLQGETGNGISYIEMNPDYTLTIVYTDGTSLTTDSIRGAKGDTGDGISTISMTNDYHLVIETTNGHSFTSPTSLKGDPGTGGATLNYNSNDRSLLISYY